MWEVGSHHPAAGTGSAAWQEAKLALFHSQFLLILNKKVKNPASSGAARNIVCVTTEWGFFGVICDGKALGRELRSSR